MGSIRGSQDGKSSNSHSRERQLQMQMEYLNAINGKAKSNLASRMPEPHNPQSQFMTSFGDASIGAGEVFEKASSSQRNAQLPSDIQGPPENYTDLDAQQFYQQRLVQAMEQQKRDDEALLEFIRQEEQRLSNEGLPQDEPSHHFEQMGDEDEPDDLFEGEEYQATDPREKSRLSPDRMESPLHGDDMADQIEEELDLQGPYQEHED